MSLPASLLPSSCRPLAAACHDPGAAYTLVIAAQAPPGAVVAVSDIPGAFGGGSVLCSGLPVTEADLCGVGSHTAARVLLPPPGVGPASAVASAVVDAEGTRAAVVYADGSAAVFSTSADAALQAITRAPDSPVGVQAAAAHGDHALFVLDDGVIVVVNTATHATEATWRPGRCDDVSGAVALANGSGIVVGSRAGIVALLPSPCGGVVLKQLAPRQRHVAPVLRLAGAQLFVAGDVFSVYDLSSGVPRRPSATGHGEFEVDCDVMTPEADPPPQALALGPTGWRLDAATHGGRAPNSVAVLPSGRAGIFYVLDKAEGTLWEADFEAPPL